MVSDDPKGPGQPKPGAPPKLDRVPDGYKPPPLRAVDPARTPAPAAPGAGPQPAGRAYVRGYVEAGLEVTPDAAMAAGIAVAGDLAQASAFRLFYLAAATQAAGRLTVTGGGAARALVFRRGTVEHASSTAADDDLFAYLLRKGALRPEQLPAAHAAREAAGGDAVGGLFGARLVNASEVAGLLQEHGAAIVGRALVADEGSWRWEPNVPPPPSSFPLGSSYALLCAAARALDVGSVRLRLGEREVRGASRVGGRIRLEDLRLTPQEARLAGGFDGRSPAELAAASPADAATVLRLALLLAEVELLVFGAQRKVEAPAPAPASAPAPSPAPPPTSPAAAAAPVQKPAPAPAPRPAAQPPRAAPPPAAAKPAAPAAAAPKPAPAAAGRPPPRLEPNALRELASHLDGKDHFEVLGVKRDATAAAIKTAYFQLAKAYHPDAVPAGATDEVRKLAAAVFARVSEAWGVLGDEARKKAYLDELATGGKADVDVAAIFQAENTFQMATVLVKARKYDEALPKFVEAMKLNPDEAEFGMWKAWCEFLLAPDRRKAYPGLFNAIEAELRRNPRCAQGYLFLGQMAKLVGEPKLAEKHLRRGLEIAPDHAELARELKYLTR